MKVIAITQRVHVVADTQERRDCLDQAWTPFLGACGLQPLLMPNHAETAVALCAQVGVAGVVLSGGNDIVAMGGDAPERDATESALLDMAERSGLPVLGVCRGMQFIQHRSGVALQRVSGHVVAKQKVKIDGRWREVNSYHNFGTYETRPPLVAWAVAEDGVIEAVRHASRPVTGIMWHPERFPVPQVEDIALFQDVFGVHQCAA